MKIENLINSKIINLKNIILIVIIFLAAVLRFSGLGSTPPSLYWDEVSQAYNAYSILKTGHDEHKEFFPIARFQAFGDYKAPVYIYLDVPIIALLGKSELAVRFPSALFGTLTVLIAYFLTKELFDKNSDQDSRKKIDVQSNGNAPPLYGFAITRRELIALLCAFFLAISPWHIQLSRVAYEGNVATFFTATGIFLFLLAKRKNSWVFILSAVSFVLGFYAFNAHRVFIPLLVVLLAVIYWREVLKYKKNVLIVGVIGIILMIPFLLYLRTPESKLRFQEVNIFSDLSVIQESNRLIAEDHNSIISKLFHNRRVLYAESYLKHYFDFFNPNFLFFTGDVNPRFSDQDNGELYLWMLPLLIVGFYWILKREGKSKYVILGWFLLAPVAAATARETPHALRGETYIPIYEIIAGYGAYMFLIVLNQYKKISAIAIAIFGVLILLSLANFLHNYFVHLPAQYSEDWQYGYKQAVTETQKLQQNYDKIIFTDSYGRAYIYVLWYGNIEPATYWQSGKVTRDVFGFYNVSGVGKYEFEKPSQVNIPAGEKVLYVGAPGELPSGAHHIEDIDFLDGKTAFIIGDNQ